MPAPAAPESPAAPAETAADTPPAAPEPRDVDINLPNSPLENVLKVYADLTGRTILRPAMLPAQQTITLVSNGKLTRTEAIQALHSVLTLNGISMINEGDRFVKAVPAQQALQEGAAFSKRSPSELPEAGEFVTQVVTLTNALPSEVVPILTPFAKIPAGIVPIDSSQTLVLRDYAPNIKRMMELIGKIDVMPELDYKLEVIPIKYGKVEDIYNVMSGLVGGGGGATGATRAATGASAMRSRGSSTRRSTSSRTTTGRPGQIGQMGQQGQVGQAGQGSSFQQRLAQIVNRAATGGEVQLLQDAKIIPDDRANTLVVYAGKHDMVVITNIVAKLDVMLAQVLVEAAIVDVSLNKSTALGVSMLQNPATSGDFTGAGGVNNGPQYLSAIGTNNLGRILPSGLTYFLNYKGDLEMAVTALASSGSVTVLQKPRIQTTHAVPASFFNGRTVPYITSSYYGGVGYGNSSTYQQLEVGIGLDVTPYITPDGLVLMEVVQTIDEIAGTTKIDNNDVPITTSRTASSTVSVRDGETIILGGFIRSSKERSRSGVPGLKDIPLLGALFRSSSTKNDRSELVVLLRPSVMLTPEDASRTLEAEKQQLPGVRLAEREYQDQEDLVQRAADKQLRRMDNEREKKKTQQKSTKSGTKELY
jgi:general secretion pathway protein D